VLDSGIVNGERTSESVSTKHRLNGRRCDERLDGTAKGGGALSAVAEVGTGIRVIALAKPSTTSRSSNQTDSISRLLGMGDVKTLVEMIEEEPPIRMERRRRCQGGVYAQRHVQQMDAIRKMGP